MPGIQSQLGGLVGLVRGRWKIRWKIAQSWAWTQEFRAWAKDTTTTTPHSYHTNTYTVIHAHIHTQIYTHTYTQEDRKDRNIAGHYDQSKLNLGSPFPILIDQSKDFIKLSKLYCKCKKNPIKFKMVKTTILNEEYTHMHTHIYIYTWYENMHTQTFWKHVHTYCLESTYTHTVLKAIRFRKLTLLIERCFNSKSGTQLLLSFNFEEIDSDWIVLSILSVLSTKFL